jgi:D-alanine-D-alanine ligase
MGGRSSEHEISIASGQSVAAGLRANGHEVVEVEIDREGVWRAGGDEVAVRPARGLLDCDVVFPVLHGPFGEDGTVQGLLECLDVPYTGSDVAASALCMDKVRFKDAMAHAGLPQVAYVGVNQATRADDVAGIAALGFPCWVKPARLGSSVGISKVASAEELDGALETAFQHDGLAIVEAFSPGIEVECAVTGNGEPEASLPAEVVLQGADWYDYEAKYAPGGVELEIPARVDSSVIAEVQALARETFVRVGCSGLARVDFFVEDGGRVLVNELNTLPGMTATSGFPKMWEASGQSFPSVCDRLLELGLERYRAERAGHAF